MDWNRSCVVDWNSSCVVDSEGCDITCDRVYQASSCIIVLLIIKERDWEQISLVD